MERINREHIVAGKLRIKVTESFEAQLESAPATHEGGKAKFNNTSVDAICTDHNITAQKQKFRSGILAEVSETDAQKIKSSGLSRWYELDVDLTNDVDKLIEKFEALDEVEIAEPAPQYELFDWTPNDNYYSLMWHLKNTGQIDSTVGADINIEPAWDVSKGNPNVIVSVIDTGVQIDHPDLEDNIWEGVGYNFASGTEFISPKSDHGTHVAGTIAASSNNGIGIAGIAGGNGTPNTGVKIMVCQCFDGENVGGFEDAFVYSAINGAAITQNSWGTKMHSYLLEEAVDFFYQNGGGNVLDHGINICAAGNYSSNQLLYPAAFDNTVSVAATGPFDELSTYSSFGETIDLCAPGGDQQRYGASGTIFSCTFDGLYAFKQGTSMACPHVSGVAALIISAMPSGLNASDLKTILTESTDNIDEVNPGFSGMIGSGRLNANNAMQMALGYFNNMFPPSEFKAFEADKGNVLISWVKSQVSVTEHIVLAFNTENTFGDPDGNTYEAGDAIVGGGTVLYSGTDELEYLHTSLTDGQSYYYCVWSTDNAGSFSFKKVTTVFTEPDKQDSYSIDFDTIETFPNEITRKPYISYGRQWQIGKFIGGLDDSDKKYLYSHEHSSAPTQNLVFELPRFDFSGKTTVGIAMRHYFRQSVFNSGKGYIQYSLDDGRTWKNIETFTTTTSNPEDFSEDVSASLAGENDVLIRFKFVNGLNAHYWCIGSIDVTSS